MERRKFLLTSGTALLGSTIATTNQKPVIGLEFDLSADIRADPSTVNSILVDFTNFELLPQYVDENAGKATITITVDVENQDTVQYSTEEQLTNGEKVTRSDIDSMIPLVVDGIDTTSSIDGEVRIDVEHPSVSDSYKQSFFISGDLILNGLVGWWPLNERSGSVAEDITGNGNDGTVNGATQGVWGRGGLTSYSFDGTDDEVVVSSTTVSGPYTVSVWVRPSGFGEQYGRVFDLQEDADNRTNLVLRGDNEYFVFEVRDSGNIDATYGSIVPLDDWIHVVCVYNQNELILYYDGSVDTTVDSTQSSPISITGPLAIGSSDGVDWLDASACDFRFYDRALSSSEVQTLYEWGSGDYTDQSLHDGTDSGAVSRYTFDGDVRTDSWGSNTLTDNTSSGTTTDAVRGVAKKFDGTDDEYLTAEESIINSETSITISTWVKFNDLSSDNAIISQKGDKNTFTLWWLDATMNLRFRVKESSGDTPEVTTSKIREGVWYNIICVADKNNGEIHLYINGLKVDSDPWDGTYNAYVDTFIGDIAGSAGQYNHDGLIDDVRIYERALSSEEVFQLFQWGTRGKDLKEAIENYQSN